MRWFVLLVLFSGFAQAITEKQLIEKYGKKRIVKFISEKTSGELTIDFNGEIRSANSPSPNYITARTIKIDLKKIGSSANKVDSIFIKIEKEKEEKVANEKRRLIELENERRLRKDARLLAEEKERLRPKDKYDLAVAVAVNKGLKIQAENDKRRAIEKRKYESKKKQHTYTARVGDSISTRCTKKWKTNYRMVKYCVDQQQKSLNQLQRSRSNIPSEINEQCVSKWGTNYKMVKYCVEQQQKSHRQLQQSNSKIPHEIKEQCKQKWGVNYRMVKYCVDRQQKSLNDLKNLGLYK